MNTQEIRIRTLSKIAKILEEHELECDDDLNSTGCFLYFDDDVLYEFNGETLRELSGEWTIKKVKKDVAP